jgi:hypothetical protein
MTDFVNSYMFCPDLFWLCESGCYIKMCHVRDEPTYHLQGKTVPKFMYNSTHE